MGMNFYDLIEFAKREQCSDVHITVGTSLAGAGGRGSGYGDHAAGRCACQSEYLSSEE